MHHVGTTLGERQALRRRASLAVLALSALLLLAILAGPWSARRYWSARSTNPVRRGVARARELGCFSCHGDQGHSGIKDPGVRDLEVPGWGGISMMYVNNADDIRKYLLNGSTPKVDTGASSTGGAPHAAIAMPSFRDVLSGSDEADLVAAFMVLSEMAAPPADSPAGSGYQTAKTWSCFSCHGAGGSGGLPNPGSLTGFIPGWYGDDFKDLVRGRKEFDLWIRDGGIPRLATNPLAARFIRRQRIQMPHYRNLEPEQLDQLWAYAGWLAKTGGGSVP